MVRGKIYFRCDQCGHIFKDIDIEMNASILSVPQKCPKCGSYHTMPAGLFNLIYKPVYKKIWNDIDNNKKQ